MGDNLSGNGIKQLMMTGHVTRFMSAAQVNK
jgi:hypothetical protein